MSITDTVETPRPYRGVPYLLQPGGAHPIGERDELIARAKALVPALRERSSVVQAERRLPPETVADLKQSGLLNMTRPREFGGYEADQQTQIDVVAELARGCGSTAWVTVVLNAGSFVGGTAMPPEGSAEMFESGEPACSVFNCRKGGLARQVEGGYVIEEGEWAWASGSQLAGWAVPRATLVDAEDKAIDSIVFGAPISDFEILDEWFTTSMRGTGSNVLRTAQLFIPEHRAGRLSRVLSGAYLAEVIEPWRTPWLSTVFLSLGPVGVGLANAALEFFCEGVDGKALAFTASSDRGELPRTHVRVAEAAARIDAATLVLHRAGSTLDWWARRGEHAPPEEKLRVRADLAMSIALTNQTVKTLYEEIGASGIMEKHPLSTIARDIEAVVMHGANNPATNFELFGAAMMGRMPDVPRFGPLAMV